MWLLTLSLSRCLSLKGMERNREDDLTLLETLSSSYRVLVCLRHFLCVQF